MKVINDSEEVRRKIQKDIAEQDVFKQNKDTIIIYPQNIVVHKALDISLIDPENIFTVQPIHDTNTNYQRINLRDGNSWRWVITTNTSLQKAILVLRVRAESPKNVSSYFKDRNIPIVIVIGDTSIIRTIWDFLSDHPEFILVAILSPVISYFGKRYFDNKNNDNPNPY